MVSSKDRGEVRFSAEMKFIWQIHYLSSLVVQPVYTNITLPYGLPLVDWRVVMTLAHAPGLSAQEISDFWAFDKMAVSRAVSSLLRRKIITRAVDKKDNRRKTLALTEKGHVIFQESWPTARKSYRRLTSALTKAELQNFLTASEKLIAEARPMVDAHLARANKPK